MTKTKAVQFSAVTAEPVRSTEPYAELVTITPEMAEEWLERNTRNRGPRAVRIEQYAGDIAKQTWHITGDSIRWGSNGVLLDGQHRLMAVVESKKPLTTFVIWNLDPKVQQYMDTGAARTPADAMRLNGEKNSSIVAAASRLAYRIENGMFFGELSRKRVSHSDIMTWLDRNTAMRRSGEMAATWHPHINMTATVIAFAHFRFAALDVYHADEFFTRLANLRFDEGSPIKAFAKRLQMVAKQDQRMSQAQLVMMSYRAWNAWREGRNVSVMPVATRWDQNGLPDLV